MLERVIHVVDDEAPVRESTAALLRAVLPHPVELHDGGPAFLKRFGLVKAGCVLLDINMPGMGGLEVQSRLNDQGAHIPIIVFTGEGDVGVAVKAMKAGAFDFLEKPCENDLLLTTVRNALAHIEASSETAARVAAAKARVGRLSPREFEVMRRLLAGKPNKIIAYDLTLSIRTVEIYRANVMEKLQARSLSVAVRTALAAGVEPLIGRDDL